MKRGPRFTQILMIWLGTVSLLAILFLANVKPLSTPGTSRVFWGVGFAFVSACLGSFFLARAHDKPERTTRFRFLGIFFLALSPVIAVLFAS